MSIIAMCRRLLKSPLGVVLLSTALLANACSSKDEAKPTTVSKGGGVSKGGASSVAGSAGTGAIVDEDPWVPPAVSEKACSISGAVPSTLGAAGAAGNGTGSSVAAAGSAPIGAAGAAGASTTTTNFLMHIGCRADYDALASEPLNRSIPGAISAKVVLDTHDNDHLYFQNSVRYPLHWDFASRFLSVAQGFEDVGAIAVFNQTQYSSPDRRFILAAVTYYEGPGLWALEFSPYDTASSAMIEKLFRAVKANAYFGDALVFHPTSDLVEKAAAALPDDIHLKTTNQIYAGIDYQPLNYGETYGQLHFVKAADIEKAYVGYRDVVVLDSIPNDISVTAGIITEQFQTPLSHINVLAVTRGTPNMGLRGATTNSKLLALDGKWVKFTVGEKWSVEETTEEAANAWWNAHKPGTITLPSADVSATDLRDIEKVTDVSSGITFDAIAAATRAFGAKSANYSVLSQIDGIPIKKAFAVPVYYYFQFMQENGFDLKVKEMLADATFQNSLPVQDQRLAELRTAMLNGTVNQTFQQVLYKKIQQEYGGKKMRFRTSTNAEDLEGFPCAGCYDSHSGDPDDWYKLLVAIKETWSGVWYYRTFREREYHGIDHLTVGMGLLVHTNFEEEEANGVAITNNIFVPSGLDPAFYVNVQWGGAVEVVHPEAGVTSDEFLYYLRSDGGRTQWISHSNLVPNGGDVLTTRQAHDLAVALDTIHKNFSPAYGTFSGHNDTGWYAMDVEFKFDNEADSTQPASLFIKQARPYPKPAQ